MAKIQTLSLFTAMTMLLATGTALADVKSHDGVEQAKPAENSQTENSQTAKEGMLLPFMNPAKGRKLYASKGCVVCHAINGVGGQDAPPLDAATMPSIMDPFDFAAKMWRGAGTMITLQEDELGEQIDFTGEELANIIAFVHSASEQKKFSKADIPERIAELMHHSDDESEEGKHDEEKSKD